VPAAAQAKEPITISVCGESGCSEASNPIVQNPFGGSDGANPPASPGAYYRLDLHAGRERWSIFYVPAAQALAIPDERGWIDWQALAGPGAPVVRRLARGVEPFPRPIVSEALLDSRLLPGEPTSYLALLEIRGAFAVPDGESVPLELRSDRRSPWTNISYRYYPDDGVLLRATGAFVRLPPRIVEDLEAELGTPRSVETATHPERSDRTGFPWLWLALGLGVGLLAVAGATLAVLRLAKRGPRLA
jgi:hypothetical protein